MSISCIRQGDVGHPLQCIVHVDRSASARGDVVLVCCTRKAPVAGVVDVFRLLIKCIRSSGRIRKNRGRKAGIIPDVRVVELRLIPIAVFGRDEFAEDIVVIGRRRDEISSVQGPNLDHPSNLIPRALTLW